MKFVRYLEIRDTIKTGDLFFVKPSNFIGKAIQFVTKSKLIHVGMFVKLGDRIFIIESLYKDGCRMMLASERFKTRDFVTVKTDVKLDDKLITDLLDDVGIVGYNLFGMLFSWVTRIKNPKEAYCAEWIVEKLNLKFDFKRNVYPIDIYNKYK